jgi:hypothetical protein
MTVRDTRATNTALYAGCEFGISGFSAIDPPRIECECPAIQTVQFFPIRLSRGSVVPVANVACTKTDLFLRRP